MKLNKMLKFLNEMENKGFGNYNVVSSEIKPLNNSAKITDSVIQAMFIDETSKELRIFDGRATTELLDLYENLVFEEKE